MRLYSVLQLKISSISQSDRRTQPCHVRIGSNQWAWSYIGNILLKYMVEDQYYNRKATRILNIKEFIKGPQDDDFVTCVAIW